LVQFQLGEIKLIVSSVKLLDDFSREVTI
jgi:hypothetical protein